MRELRFRHVWLIGGFLLMALVLYSAISRPSAAATLLNDKVVHACAFAALMTWFCGVFRLRWSPWVAVALLAFGVSIELIQHQLIYRSAEVADAFADFAGIMLGWVLAAVGMDQWSSVIERWYLKKKNN